MLNMRSYFTKSYNSMHNLFRMQVSTFVSSVEDLTWRRYPHDVSISMHYVCHFIGTFERILALKVLSTVWQVCWSICCIHRQKLKVNVTSGDSVLLLLLLSKTSSFIIRRLFMVHAHTSTHTCMRAHRHLLKLPIFLYCRIN